MPSPSQKSGSKLLNTPASDRPLSSETLSDSTDSDEYGTPRWLVETLLEAVPDNLLTNGRFSLDPASGAEPTPIATHRYTKADDGLAQPWRGPHIDSIYLNPPYSDPAPFLSQLTDAVTPDDPEAPTVGIALTKVDTSTRWFQEIIAPEATAICFLNSRLSFHNEENDAAFANALSLFGDAPETLLSALSDLGTIFSQQEIEAAARQQRLSEITPESPTAAVVSTPREDSPSTDTPPLQMLSARDTLKLTFRTTGLGTAAELPKTASVSILPGTKSIDTETGAVSIGAIGHTETGTDICLRLRSLPNAVNSLEASLATGMGKWQIAPIRRLSLC